MGKAQINIRPVSSHPLFPVVVAMWFAALFGFGSLAIRPALLEAVVLATRIGSLLPAATAPLGLTARILLALALAGVGTVLGLMLGRRIARSGVQPRRPLYAHEDLTHGSLDAPIDAEFELVDADDIPYRRRMLLITDETERSELLDSAPLAHPEMRLGAHDADPVTADDFTLPFAPRQLFVPETPGPIPLASAADKHAENTAQDLDSRDLASLDVVELAERLARAMQRRRDARAISGQSTAETSPTPAAIQSFDPEATDEGDEEFELPSLLSSRPAAAVTSFGEAIGAADEDEDEDEEHAAATSDAYGSLLGVGRPQSVRIEDEPVVIFPGQTPVAQSGPRLFDPPGTLPEPARTAAPAAAAAVGDAAKTERALRAALASLQRMTGTA